MVSRFDKDFITKLKKSNKYENYIYNKPEYINNCQETKMILNPSQKLYRDIIKPSIEKNNNGLLIYAGTGFGKTLSALLIASNYQKEGYITLYITRTTLKDNLYKDYDKLKINPQLIFPCTYKQFSNLYHQKGPLYKKLVSIKKSSNIFDKTLIIVDEAHKLFGKNLKFQETHNIQHIQDMIYGAYERNENLKVILMTATPIESDPMEAIHLLNLLIYKKLDRFPEEKEKFKEEYLDSSLNFKKDAKLKFSQKIQGLISYIDNSYDVSRFAQINLNYIDSKLKLSNFLKIVKECKF